MCAANKKVGTELPDLAWFLALCLVLALPRAETLGSTYRLRSFFDLPSAKAVSDCSYRLYIHRPRCYSHPNGVVPASEVVFAWVPASNFLYLETARWSY